MLLNDRLSRAISSRPSTGMAVSRSSVRAMCSTTSVSRSTGASPARAMRRPATAAPTTPTADTATSSRARLFSDSSTWVRGLATDTAKPSGSRRVNTRIGVPSAVSPSR